MKEYDIIMMTIISFLVCFFLSIIVTNILINKNNKTKDKHVADALNYRQIAHSKKAKHNKQQIYVPPELAMRLISKYCHAPDGTTLNDMLLAEALVHNMQ